MDTTRHTQPVAGGGDHTVAARLRGVSKRFGGVQALSDITLDFLAGEVHALVGENGAGKSTCLGSLAGRVVPDHGEVTLFGEPAPVGRPREMRALGVSAIYQELTIVPHLTTQANVFLGNELSQRGVLRDRDMADRLREVCDVLDVQVPVGAAAGTMSVAGQQLLEILRAVISDPKLILFDEPTASLAPHEREVLYTLIRRFRDDGVGVAFVSHNLEEVLSLSDTISVFRNGKLVRTDTASAWTKQSLIEAMTGNALAGAAPNRPDVAADDRRRALEVRRLRVGRKVSGAHLSASSGEIVGIAGLVGSGRSTCLRALAGVAQNVSGELTLDGTAVEWPHTARAAQRAGIFLIPEDRRHAGLVMPRSGIENILLSSYPRVARHGVVRRQDAVDVARTAAVAVGFNPTRLDEPVANLSGGNQQKIVLARAVCRRPRVLLADEPTRGVDVGAKAEIMATLRELASTGMAVLAVSSELEELEEMCDRVYVLAAGRIVGELTGADMTASTMIQMAFERMDEESTG